MNTKNDAGARRDPFNEVLPLEDLRIAADLIGRRPIAKYWADHPTPLRPLGRLKNEGLRQLATFLFPFLLLAGGAYLAQTLVALVLLVPASLVLGYLLDKKLKNDIRAMRAKDDEIDRGRYEAVRVLCARTGLAPEEITLKLIEKMAMDFVHVTSAIEAREAAAEAEAHRATLARIRSEEAARGSRRPGRNRGASPSAIGAGAAVAAVVASADEDVMTADRVFARDVPALNPTTGLPMMHGSMGVDVGGTAFGSEPM